MRPDLVSLGGSFALVDELYARYLDDPDSVSEDWRELFSTGRIAIRAQQGASADRSQTGDAGPSVWPLVNAYRVRGHLQANLDPLQMRERPKLAYLNPATYGFGPDDLNKVFDTGGLYGCGHNTTLEQVLLALEAAYCGPIGLEYMHITDQLRKDWLSERMELLPAAGTPPDEVRRWVLDKLVKTDCFEHFVHSKYPATKRFSIEGAEALVPLVEEVVEQLGRHGAIEVVLGMAHRGRLSLLVQTLRRRPRDLFSEFDDVEPEMYMGAGDVKYHMGGSCDRVTRFGNNVHLTMAYNPSHLEAVDPVVVGRVRAKQRRYRDDAHRLVAGLLIHGDAAFAGQGIVAETLQMSALHGYRTGGTIHIIVNNQIGFTATPDEYRSTPYCTDIAKMIQCPIWHVNGEDPDAVLQVAQMAVEYRARFQSDVVIDMFCYRRFGHNEMDEPSFTQPAMYRAIQNRKTVSWLYGDRLIEEGLTTGEEIARQRQRCREGQEAELEASRQLGRRLPIPSMGGAWEGFAGGPEAEVEEVDTGVPLERLREVSDGLTRLPADFVAHSKIERLLDQRREMGQGQRSIDWGMAELLAMGTLVRDGTLVRLSGQDSSRGTFSHRHAVLVDQSSGEEYVPLASLHPEQAPFLIYDSPLSEVGVLGFEFGFSLDYPDSLVIWEAQFGDFANGAQVIIDQFIMTSEDKWRRLSGLVMFLPHGYEGQGPEHSSARFERFLQLAAEDNVQIAQPSTPAQMFHLLRRQVVRRYRKPLVVLTPKSLLRLPAATSDLAELTGGRFARVLDDPDVSDRERVTRVLLCSGRLYYDLVAERKGRSENRVAIVRLEQFYPWKGELVAEVLRNYRRTTEVFWVQDEPANMGAAQFLWPRLGALDEIPSLTLVSRVESASPATGSGRAHQLERDQLLERALGGTFGEEQK